MTATDLLQNVAIILLAAASLALTRRVRWLERQRPLVGPKGEPGKCRCEDDHDE